MRVKKAAEICRNIKADNISDSDKFEAIDTILESQQGSFNISKPVAFEVLAWTKKTI